MTRPRLVLFTAPWRRAPFLLWRSPPVVAAVIGGALVLGGAAAATPLFLSSAGNAIQAEQVDARCPWDIGASFSWPAFDADAFDEAVGTEAATVEGLGEPITTFLSQDLRLGLADDPSVSFGVQVMSRTDALDHVEAISPQGGEGVWLPDTVADGMGAVPGDVLVVGVDGAEAAVAGVYRDLRIAGPLPDFWCSQQAEIVPQGYGDDPPPPLVLADETTYQRVIGQPGLTGREALWELPAVDGRARELEGARRLVRSYDGLSLGIEDRLEAAVGRDLVVAGARSTLPFIVGRSSSVVAAVRSHPAGGHRRPGHRLDPGGGGRQLLGRPAPRRHGWPCRPPVASVPPASASRRRWRRCCRRSSAPWPDGRWPCSSCGWSVLIPASTPLPSATLPARRASPSPSAPSCSVRWRPCGRGR